MKKVLLTVVLVLVAQMGIAQDKPAKKDVQKLVEVSGVSEVMKETKDFMKGMVKPDKQADFIKEFDKAMPGLNDKLVGVYMNICAKEDVSGLIAYYEHPAGKMMPEKVGEISQKTKTAIRDWAVEVGQNLMMKYL